MTDLARSTSKKCEFIEVRVTYDDKQALMRKAALDGRSASEIVRRSIADYMRGPPCDQRNTGNLAKYAAILAAIMAAGIAVIFAYSSSPPATAEYRRAYESLLARQRFERAGVVERRLLAEKFAKDFARQRLMFLEPDRPGERQVAFAGLDVDLDGRLSVTEYRQLMNVPDGEPGRKKFESLDRNRDGRLAEAELKL